MSRVHKLNPSSRRNFTAEEDQRLKDIVRQVGLNDWEKVSQLMGTRNVRQCKDRWYTYLDPGINSEPWTEKEDQLLVSLYQEIGPKWVKMSRFFIGRSDNSIKNRWYYHLKKHFSGTEVSNNQKMSPPQPSAVPICSAASIPVPQLTSEILLPFYESWSVNQPFGYELYDSSFAFDEAAW